VYGVASGGPDLPFWARPEPGSRRPRFSRQQIARLAIEIADAEGFEAVSMRRIATELGAGTMSLYHYVATKDELIALMDDALMAEALVPRGELPGDWRDAVAVLARHTRAALLRHPWALLALQESQFGPNAMAHFEQSLAAVAGTGLDRHEKFDLLALVDAYVFGTVLHATEAKKRAAIAAERPELVRAAIEYGLAQLRSGELPHLAALFGGVDAATEAALAATGETGRATPAAAAAKAPAGSASSPTAGTPAGRASGGGAARPTEPAPGAAAAAGPAVTEEALEEQFERGLQAVLEGAARTMRIPRRARRR